MLLLLLQDDLEMEVDSWVRRKFEGLVKEVEVVYREDLDLVGCCVFNFLSFFHSFFLCVGKGVGWERLCSGAAGCRVTGPVPLL